LPRQPTRNGKQLRRDRVEHRRERGHVAGFAEALEQGIQIGSGLVLQGDDSSRQGADRYARCAERHGKAFFALHCNSCARIRASNGDAAGIGCRVRSSPLQELWP
jgi:hypothetical protein